MTLSPTSSDRLMSITMTLMQYPILSKPIRRRMLEMIIERGIRSAEAFEGEVVEAAQVSREREGFGRYSEEPPDIWNLRIERVRDQLTDLLFSQSIPMKEFEGITGQVLSEHGVGHEKLLLSINPELAPIDLVFEQALLIESLPEEERLQYAARLMESKVVLIRRIISDQLQFINIAKEWLTISELAEIQQHKVGTGRIGGKAAGILLAFSILRQVGNPELKSCLRTPESYYIGSDELYNYMAHNNLMHWNDQKYKTEEEMREQYPQILQDYINGKFSPSLLKRLERVLLDVGSNPIIVRSSSLLEDNFGTSFAGKYDSVFLPNQGTPAENLEALCKAIAHVYGCVLNPNALLYRRSRGLQDYDERMALLIQVVQGEKYHQYFLPHAAGVAFSRNTFRWAPQIKYEQGFIRLVWGLGTRAVDRVANDYPRLIALSHPMLRPSSEAKSIVRYSQHYVDLIDLKENEFKTLPVSEVLDSTYHPLRFIAQVERDTYFETIRSRIPAEDSSRLVLTFEGLLQRTHFADLMREMISLLENTYHLPVDMEFSVQIEHPHAAKPALHINVLQCRPLATLFSTDEEDLPAHIPRENIIFQTHFVVPKGLVKRVDYAVFVVPSEYFAIDSMEERHALARVVGRLNAALKDQSYICLGPGRWGSSNPDLGVPIAYGDIYYSKSLVEMTGPGIGLHPEPSLGTHFFQDLLESQIYPLAICLDDEKTIFNEEFFYRMPNRILEWIRVDEKMANRIRLIKVSDYRPNTHIKLNMKDDQGKAAAYLEPNP